MAIIRLDCNLNGGDSVTPNNELFYRIYGDVDNFTAPIHTTGTALSDANVTVNGDGVMITGVDGATSTEFKIAAVDAAFNEGILSDAYETAVNEYIGADAINPSNEVNSVGLWTEGGAGALSVTDIDAQNGLYSLVTEVTVNQYEYMQLAFGLEFPQAYQFRFFAKKDTGNGTLLRSFIGFDETPEIEITSTDWQEYTVNLTTNTNTLQMRLYPSFNGIVVGAKAWIDNFRIYKI